ncbi:MAG: hypothetical protein DDT18_00742 [Actinobacteria bacterium]|nr:hypothetical protein [Actinomycetota bacterium]
MHKIIVRHPVAKSFGPIIFLASLCGVDIPGMNHDVYHLPIS